VFTTIRRGLRRVSATLASVADDLLAAEAQVRAEREATARPPTPAEARRAARAQREREELAANAQRERDEYESRKARKDATVKLIADQCAANGWFFPSDFTGSGRGEWDRFR
jgi:hypothetical protein